MQAHKGSADYSSEGMEDAIARGHHTNHYAMPAASTPATPNNPPGLRQQLLASLRASGTTAAPMWRGVSLAALTALTGTASAQTPAPKAKPADAKPEPAATEGGLSEVIVRGIPDAYYSDWLNSPKYTASLLNTPQSVSIIPQSVMRDQNATNLRDVLRNVSGVTIQAGEGGATPGDNFVIRGYSARTDLFIDGVRDAGGFYRDPFNIEQVEVFKGPASANTGGRGSTGGSINLVTKKPTAERFYRSTLTAGTSEFYRATIDLNQPFHLFGGSSSSATSGGYSKDGKSTPAAAIDAVPNAAFRLNAVWHENEVAGRDEVGNKRWGIAPSLTLGLNQPTNVTFSYSHLDQDNVPDFGLPWVTATNNALIKYRNQPAPVSYSNYYGISDRDFERVRTDEAEMIVNHAFNDDFSLRYTLHYGRNIRDSIISAPRFISDASSLINREFQSRDQVDTVLTNDINLTAKFDTFGAKHTLVGGVEYTRENSKVYLRSGPAAPLADLFNPDVNAPFTGPVTRTGAVNEADTETFAVYILDTIKLGDKWQLSGSLRGDYFDVDYDMKNATGLVTPFRHTDKEWSWRASLSYKPVENGTIYFGYGTSFNPSAEGLALQANVANLDPERTSTFELGTKWEFLDRRLGVAAAVFHTEKENARTPNLVPGAPMVLEGEQEVNGFEISATGSLTKAWKVIAGYTYLDTEIKKSNNPLEVGSELPGVPKNSFTLWTTYDVTEKLLLGVGAQFVDERFANPINTRLADSYLTFDAMAAYRFNDHFSLQINVTNLTDEEYISGLHIQGSFGHFIPGTGRTASVTASVAF
jgi:catecholate siderophore receptor